MHRESAAGPLADCSDAEPLCTSRVHPFRTARWAPVASPVTRSEDARLAAPSESSRCCARAVEWSPVGRVLQGGSAPTAGYPAVARLSLHRAAWRRDVVGRARPSSLASSVLRWAVCWIQMLIILSSLADGWRFKPPRVFHVLHYLVAFCGECHVSRWIAALLEVFYIFPQISMLWSSCSADYICPSSYSLGVQNWSFVGASAAQAPPSLHRGNSAVVGILPTLTLREAEVRIEGKHRERTAVCGR